MRLFCALLAVAAILPSVARAQCADGSPPPCVMRRVAVAAPTRPLDERNWLVLPFDNIARDQTLDVVREASVTLMYSAMSQWNDILVVDDARVADLVRGIDASKRIGMETALDLAKRVGAGKLVTGTLIKEGQRTRVQAAVYDVKSGRRLRSPSLATVGTDSLSTVFASLAERVLGVPAPAGAKPSESGTQNTEALRAYVSGLEAERRLADDSAVMFYRKAVSLDSTFGLAHYHLSQTLGSIPGEAPGAADDALETAQRFAAGLPAKERGQVAVLLALRRNDATTACSLVDQTLAKDSLDAWAWWSHGNCRYQLLPGDTSIARRFSTDNARIADWRRAAALDSSFFAPIQLIDTVLDRGRECRAPTNISPICPDSELFESELQLRADTLVHVLHRPFIEGVEYRNSPSMLAARHQRLELRRAILSRFLIANPAHVGAHLKLAGVLDLLNDLAGAEREMAAARGSARLLGWRRVFYLSRFEFEIRRGQPARANVFADSVYSDLTAGTQPQAGSVVGRYSLDAMARHRGTDTLIALRKAWLPVFAGILPRNWETITQQYATLYAAAFSEPLRPRLIADVKSLSTLIAFRMTRQRPLADTARPDPIYRFQAWYAAGDTTRARAGLRESDAALDRRPPEAQDDGAWLFNAEGHVALGDSAAGLSRLRDWVRRHETDMAVQGGYLMVEHGFPLNNIGRAYGRTWLLYADLAAAAHRDDEARKAYQFVVDLWSKGEAPVQPLVARAKAALAQLR